MDRTKSVVKLYCEDHLENEITEKLKFNLKQYKYFEGNISYKGKNLNRVKEILDHEI